MSEAKRLTDEQVAKIARLPDRYGSHDMEVNNALMVLSTGLRLLLTDRQALLNDIATLRRLLAERVEAHGTEGD